MSDTYADLEEMECKNLYTHSTAHYRNLLTYTWLTGLTVWYSYCDGCKEDGVYTGPVLWLDYRQRYQYYYSNYIKVLSSFWYCNRCILYVYLSMLHSSLRRRSVLWEQLKRHPGAAAGDAPRAEDGRRVPAGLARAPGQPREPHQALHRRGHRRRAYPYVTLSDMHASTYAI